VPTCPKGHQSTAADYCDECGTPIGAAPTPVPAPPPAPAQPEAEAEPGGEPCPECATPRTDRFCEVCGHDFLAQPARAGSVAQSLPVRGAEAPAAPTTPKTWRIVVSADRAFYERMQAGAVPDADPVTFPVYCPQRQFAITGPEVLIGRRSRSRGIEPQVDLTGPPEDAAVSHMHALLVATPDGWNLVDLDSTNGTYLNDTDEQVPANQPVPVGDGDRIHVGGWTTLTLQAA
jgi:hypothetical protein